MLRKKFNVIVEDGDLKEAFIKTLSWHQEKNHIHSSRTMRREVEAAYPELKGKPYFFIFKNITDTLTLVEGSSKTSWIKYTFEGTKNED